MAIKTAYYTDPYVVNPAEITGVKLNENNEVLFEIKTQDGYIEYKNIKDRYFIIDKSEADRKVYGLG